MPALEKSFLFMLRKTWLKVLLLAIFMLLLLVGNKVFNRQQSLYTTGKNIYLAYGCSSCHGDAGADPIRRSSLKTAPNLFEHWLEAQDILESIQFGSYDNDFESASKHNAGRLKMPPYALYLNQGEITALVVYLQSHQILNDPKIKKSKAIQIAINAGCFGCHGPLGLGGAVNPKSVKNAIPGWFGDDFDALTENGNLKYIQEWIKYGRSRAITDKSLRLGNIASWFLSRQAIKMPAYKERLDEQDIKVLSNMVLSFRKSGDLDIKAIGDLKKRLDSLPVEPVEKDSTDPLDEEFTEELFELGLEPVLNQE